MVNKKQASIVINKGRYSAETVLEAARNTLVKSESKCIVCKEDAAAMIYIPTDRSFHITGVCSKCRALPFSVLEMMVKNIINCSDEPAIPVKESKRRFTQEEILAAKIRG